MTKKSKFAANEHDNNLIGGVSLQKNVYEFNVMIYVCRVHKTWIKIITFTTNDIFDQEKIVLQENAEKYLNGCLKNNKSLNKLSHLIYVVQKERNKIKETREKYVCFSFRL